MADVLVTFGTDLAAMKRDIAQLNALIVAGMGKGLDTATRSAKLSGSQIKTSFRDIGQAVGIVSALIGGQTAQWVGFAAVAATSIGSVAKVLTALVGGPITITIGIIGVLAAAIIGVASHFDAFKQTVTKVWNYIVGFIARAVETLIKLLSKIPFIGDEIEESFEGIRRAAAEWREEADANIASINRLEAAQERLKKKNEAVTKTLSDLAAVSRRNAASLAAFGVSQEYLDSRAQALRQTIIQLIADGISPESELIKNAKREYAAAAEASERFRQAEERRASAHSLVTEELKKMKKEQDEVLLKGNIVDRIVSKETEAVIAGRLENIRQEFAVFIAELRFELEDLMKLSMDVWSNFSSGFGNAVAQALVYGESFRSGMAGVLNAVAAQLIAFVAKTFIEVAASAISQIVLNTYAAYSSIPFVGLALAAAAAAAAIAGARALAKKEGGRAFAEGGVVMSPTLGLVGEAGPEIVLPLRRAPEVLADVGISGEKTQLIQLHIGERLVASMVARGMPDVLRLEGIRA